MVKRKGKKGRRSKVKSLNVSGNLVGAFTLDALTDGATFTFLDATLGHAAGDTGNKSLKDDVAKFGKTALDPIRTDPVGTITHGGIVAISGKLLQKVYRKATGGGITVLGYKLR